MLIEFTRSGGVAGMRLAKTIDTASLPADSASQLASLVAAANFFDLPANLSAPSSGADRFQYKISIRDASRSHTIQVAESAIPLSLAPLIKQLEALARTR